MTRGWRLDLAERSGDCMHQLQSLWSLWVTELNKGQCRAGLELARRFCATADGSSDPNDAFVGDRLMAYTLHFLGDQSGARRHIDQVNVNPLHTLQPSCERARQAVDVGIAPGLAERVECAAVGVARHRVVEHVHHRGMRGRGDRGLVAVLAVACQPGSCVFDEISLNQRIDGRPALRCRARRGYRDHVYAS